LNGTVATQRDLFHYLSSAVFELFVSRILCFGAVRVKVATPIELTLLPTLKDPHRFRKSRDLVAIRKPSLAEGTSA
jgi:hypothetical protein